MRAWAALRPVRQKAASRLCTRAGLTELVGREEELELAAATLVKGKDRRRPSRVALWRSRALASLDSRRRSWNASPVNPTRAYATSARRSTPTARSTRSSVKWSAPLDLRTTTTRKRSSTSSMPCLRRVQRHARTRHCLPKCYRCRTMDAIPTLELAPQQRRAENDGSAYCATGGAGEQQSGADDLRGCALDRPDEPGSARSRRGPDKNAWRCC